MTERKTGTDLDRLASAGGCEAFPCNPRPFANGINAGCAEHGTDWIRTDQAKRILFILIAQSYGQLARIDLADEWDRLFGAADGAA